MQVLYAIACAFAAASLLAAPLARVFPYLAHKARQGERESKARERGLPLPRP
jgi:hypothetical protein